MIEVQHLTKRYGRVTAVDDVSFRVERGEILGFLGPNGAGKTTTMRILTGYMPATDGKALVAGFDVFDQPIEAKRRTGYLPETPPLYPDMSVVEYLEFVAKIKGVPPAERSKRIKEVMGRTRIADMANRQCVEALEGIQAARRPRAGAHPQSRRPDPRRADRRPRSETDHRDATADQGARRRSHDHPEHAHPPRGLADLPARRHHQQGPRRGDRHAGQSDGAARRRQDDVRAGGRGRRGCGGGARPRSAASRASSNRTAAARPSATKWKRSRAATSAAIWRRPVVTSGWGLLELRPTRMSLEEIFLSLTTEDTETDGGGAAAGDTAHE